MNLDLFMNLVNNILLVMSMALIYSVFKNDSFFHPILRKIMMGLMVGFIISIVMYNSYPLSLIDQGLKFDARAVLLSVSGMFFGLIPTVIGIITAIIIRIYQGGVGTLTGISWIVVSGSLGLVWRYFRLKPKKPRT